MDTTEATLKALGTLLRDNYGTYDGEKDAVNYATLWNTLLDALEGGTLDREMLDAVYIKQAQDRDLDRRLRLTIKRD